jgi:large subunit ribosomal protein L21
VFDPAFKSHTFTAGVDLVTITGFNATTFKNSAMAGATVTAEVVEPLVKGEKIFIQKFRRRKSFDKKTGHRQTYTKVKVTGITG